MQSQNLLNLRNFLLLLPCRVVSLNVIAIWSKVIKGSEIGFNTTDVSEDTFVSPLSRFLVFLYCS